MAGGIIGNTDFNTSEVESLVGSQLKKDEKPAEIKPDSIVTGEPKNEIQTQPIVEKKPDLPNEKEQKPVVAEKKDDIPDPLSTFFTELKDKYGVTTKEELEAVLQTRPKKEETPEEKAKREKTYSIDLDKYLQENNIMSREKLIEYETVKTKSDKDLAIENFTKEFKAENADADEDDIADAIESKYHLKTENPKLKKVGEAILKKDATSIRSSYDSSYNIGKGQFDEDQKKLAQIPQFNQYIDNYAKSLPSTIKLLEKEGTTVNFDITPEARTQIVATALRTPEVFLEFTKNGDSPKFKELLQSKVRDQIKILNFDSVINVTAETMYSKGLKSGSTVGAKQPFAIVKETVKNQATKSSKEEAKANVLKDNEESLARR